MIQSRKNARKNYPKKSVKISDEDYALLRAIAISEKRFIYYILSCAINEYAKSRTN
jgi:hypothetical protein